MTGYTFLCFPQGRQCRRASLVLPLLVVSHCDIIPAIPLNDTELRRLLEDCLSGKPERWSEFVVCCHPVIQAAVVRAIRRCGQLTPELVDDLVQDTYLRLCANDYKVLREFRFLEEGGLRGLLESVAVSAVFDYFRRRIAIKRGAGKDPIPIQPALEPQTAAAGGSRSTEQLVLFEQIDKYLQQVTPVETAARDRRIFWMYYRHGFSAKEIAALPGLSLTAKGVESLLHRLTTQIKQVVSGFDGPEKGAGA